MSTMKKRTFKHILTCLLAVVMIVGMIAPASAAAGDIHLDTGVAYVYLNDVKLAVNAYVDGESHIRVETRADLEKAFPQVVGLSKLPIDGFIINDYADYYGYGWSQSENTIYLYSNNGYVPTPGIDDPQLPLHPSDVEVFVNGMRLSNTGVYVYGDEFFIENTTSLRAIFKEAAKDTLSKATSLRTLAKKYKYTLVYNEYRVYLNNDGKKALEMTLNGKLVSFPDQQPIVVDPGRTMIPVRAVAELLDCEVEFDAPNSRVIITKGNSKMILWLGSTSYWKDGSYGKMDVKPYILNGRTMVPARFIAEAFGYVIKYDASTTVPTVRLSST